MQADLVSRLFDEWAASYARGERPDPREYLTRAGADADELGCLMESWLLASPRAEPDDESVALARAWVSGASPLVELRARHGVKRNEVVDAVVKTFDLDLSKRAKVKEYYHRLESGLLDPRGLSPGLVDLLAKTLRARTVDIVAWRPRTLAAAPVFRAAEAAKFDALAVDTRESEEPHDEVDALFISGRER